MSSQGLRGIKCSKQVTRSRDRFWHPPPRLQKRAEPIHPAWAANKLAAEIQAHRYMAPHHLWAWVQLHSAIQEPLMLFSFITCILLSPCEAPATLGVSHFHAFAHSLPVPFPLSAQLVPAAPSRPALWLLHSPLCKPQRQLLPPQCYCRNLTANWNITVCKPTSPLELCGQSLAHSKSHTG